VEILRDRLTTRMNLESAVTEEMIGIALKIKPHDICLVPERREELTTEGGLDVVKYFDQIKCVCQKLGEAGIRVSLFINADPLQIDAAARASAPVIEIHTGSFADAVTPEAQEKQFAEVKKAVAMGIDLGLKVNAGHGLHYENVQQIAALSEISELNIGHAIVARAIFVGFKQAVHEMKQLMLEARE